MPPSTTRPTLAKGSITGLHLQWSMAERAARAVFDAITRSGTRVMSIEAAYGVAPRNPTGGPLAPPTATNLGALQSTVGIEGHASAHAHLVFQRDIDGWLAQLDRGLFPFLRTVVDTLPALQGPYAHAALRLEGDGNGSAGTLRLHVNGVRVSEDPVAFVRRAMLLEPPTGVYGTPGAWVYAASSAQAQILWEAAQKV